MALTGLRKLVFFTRKFTLSIFQQRMRNFWLKVVRNDIITENETSEIDRNKTSAFFEFFLATLLGLGS